ncbi:type VI secretion system ATPase TssH [Polyangium jinanense]|uniref:Type VI secretion system ATPase TssH n=1 Tax=Polyangium jinanense TaxID=2829994 RepID=A0A9X3X7N4_9BACT|nr:type VI secretion system ATPase TssH [Polyangium jinanense]MDC3985554.1 type VI secretion system ATPase TssH [Polyangium jinanense]
MLVEAKSIIKRLTKVCTAALEAAVVQCVNARHYEVTVEHLLLALLDDANSDIAFIVMHYDLDPARLRQALQRSLSDLRTGNAGKPVFSPTMLEWMQDAFVVGSMEYGYTKTRSGALFARLVNQPTKYTMSGIGALLEGISREDVKNNLPKIISGSKEDVETAPVAAGGAGGATGPGGLPQGAASASADSALAKYCVDYTGRARAGQIDPIFGREGEIRQMIDILGRRRKNNPIIVGDSGVGKTALVEGMALMIVNNQVPPIMQGVEILGLDLGLLQAGAGVKGEFENRMKQVISEIKGSPKPIILFIDEAHTIIGAGNQQGAGDAANLLKPALARGELRTIAATTWAEYKKYFEKDAALARRFQPVKVDEPSEAVAITMIRGLRPKFEEAHNVIVSDEAVVAAVKLSARYISGRLLPDKAVDLLDTCSARVKIALQQKPAQVEDIEVRIDTLTRELEALKRDRDAGLTIEQERVEYLEDRIAKSKVELENTRVAYDNESAGAKKVLEARKRMDEAKTTEEKDAIRREVVAAISDLHKSQGEVPLLRPDVDEAMVAAVVSAWTGIPVGKMVSDSVKALVEMESRLNTRIKGQGYALETVAKELRAARAGLKPQNTPMGVFLFVGPSGVGKTETALALADMLFGGERMMVTINMSEFQEKHTTSRLIGSPPGYVGYGEGGMLTEGVRQRPYTVVLLDECEKADPDVMNLFYQVFDKGMLTDGTGLLVDFKNTVIIMTSNLATDKITNHVVSAWEENREPVIREIYEEIKPTLSAHFKPALLARMTVVPYIPISPAALGEITRLKLNGLVDRLKKSQKIDATYSDRMVDLIASRCTEVDTGARNIDHILRASLLPMLSQEILTKMAEGVMPKKLFIDIDDQKNFTATFPE